MLKQKHPKLGQSAGHLAQLWPVTCDHFHKVVGCDVGQGAACSCHSAEASAGCRFLSSTKPTHTAGLRRILPPFCPRICLGQQLSLLRRVGTHTCTAMLCFTLSRMSVSSMNSPPPHHRLRGQTLLLWRPGMLHELQLRVFARFTWRQPRVRTGALCEEMVCLALNALTAEVGRRLQRQ